jgi:hypothetical protein
MAQPYVHSTNQHAATAFCLRLQVFDSPSPTPHAYSALCSGTDFWQHHMPPELDIATAAVFPDKWLACSNECKLDWVSGEAVHGAGCTSKAEQTAPEHLVLSTTRAGAASSSRMAKQTRVTLSQLSQPCVCAGWRTCTSCSQLLHEAR